MQTGPFVPGECFCGGCRCAFRVSSGSPSYFRVMCFIFLLLGTLLPHLWIPPPTHRLFLCITPESLLLATFTVRALTFCRKLEQEMEDIVKSLWCCWWGELMSAGHWHSVCVCCRAGRHWLIKVHGTETEQSQGWAGYPAEEVKGDWLCLSFGLFFFCCCSCAVLP